MTRCIYPHRNDKGKRKLIIRNPSTMKNTRPKPDVIEEIPTQRYFTDTKGEPSAIESGNLDSQTIPNGRSLGVRRPKLGSLPSYIPLD